MKEKHLLLALDTSTAMLTVALLAEGKTIDTIQSMEERNHSVRLVHEIRELVRRNGYAMKDLGAVAAGRGPGSYTGIRIGVTAAKTIAWSLDIPLIGVSSLEAMAQGAREEASPDSAAWIVPLMDARRGQAYTALYEARSCEARLHALENDGVRLMSDWLDALAARLDKSEGPVSIHFVGEAGLFAELIESSDLARNASVSIRESRIDAAHVGGIAADKWRRGEQEDVYSFVPNYTQLAEAEVKRLARLQNSEAHR